MGRPVARADPFSFEMVISNMARLNRLVLTALVIAALTLIAVTAAACDGEDDTVRMGTEGAYPPYSFVNDAGEVDGFERELGDELCRRAELQCTWVTNEWDTIIPNLLDDQYDTILAGMSVTDERDEIIDFTQPYFPPAPSLYVALSGATDDVVNSAVAAQVQTVHSDYLSEEGVTLLEFETVEEIVEAVLNGEVDAAMFDEEFAQEIVRQSGGALDIVGPSVFLDMGIGIGLREGDTELRDKLDNGIGEMKEDGSLNTLIRKWFDDDVRTF